MNWRWLIMDYVDPRLGLDWPKRRAIWWSIRTRPRDLHPQHAWRMYLFALVPAAVMLLMLLPIFLFDMRWWYVLALVPVQLCITWLAMALIGRWAHMPLVVEALREQGYDVCRGCGYDLHDLPSQSAVCPECGESRASGVVRSS